MARGKTNATGGSLSIKNATVEQFLSLSENVDANFFVEKIPIKTLGQTRSPFSEYIITASSTVIPLSDTKVLWFYQDTSSYIVYAVVVNVNINDLNSPTATSGSKLLIKNSGTAYNMEIVGVVLPNNQVLVAVGRWDKPLYCYLLSVDNDVITILKTVTIDTYLGRSPGLSIIELSNNKALLTYGDVSKSSLQCVLLSCNNNDIVVLNSSLSSFPYSANSSGVPVVKTEKINNNQVAVLSAYTYNTPNLNVMMVTIGDNNTISFGTTLYISGNVGLMSYDILKLNERKLFVNYNSSSYCNYGMLSINDDNKTFTLDISDYLYNNGNVISVSSPWCSIDYYNGIINTVSGHSNSIKCIKLFMDVDTLDVRFATDNVIDTTNYSNNMPSRTIPHTVVDANHVLITFGCDSSSDGNSVVTVVNMDTRVQKSKTKIDGVTKNSCEPNKAGSVYLLNN